MNNTRQKLSLYIRCEPADIVMDVMPGGFRDEQDGLRIFETEIPAGRTSTVRVRLFEMPDPTSHIEIVRVLLNDIELKNLPSWSTYRSSITGNVIYGTHGYMHEPGEYVLRLHQNALVHNYLSFFREKCCV